MVEYFEWRIIFLDFMARSRGLGLSHCSLFFQERRAKGGLLKKKIAHDFLQYSSAETNHLLRRLWLRSQSVQERDDISLEEH